MTHARLAHLAAAAVVLAAAAAHLPAAAQYVWLDDKGTKQYSDMPPPASVPASRILKQPGKWSPPAASPTGDKPAATGGMSIAEQNADFKKRQAERAEKEAKSAEEAQQAADKAKSCERARNYQRVLDSGERITQPDKSGERSFMTDEQRAQELRDVKRMLEKCK